MTKTIWYLEDSADQFLTIKELLDIELQAPTQIVNITTYDSLKTRIHTGQRPNLLIADNQLSDVRFVEEYPNCSVMRETNGDFPVIVYSGMFL